MRLPDSLRATLSLYPSAKGKRPDFFIIGAPKCGTTALAAYLSKHPEIFMARKEMHHFGRDLRFGPQIYRRSHRDYLQEFAGCNVQARAGEASVWYLYSAEAAAEIKAFNPRARIIIMLREPTEMMYSLYHQFRLDGNEHLPTFAAALAAEEDRLTGRQVTRHTYFPQGLSYRAVASYTEQVRRYLELFGRGQVHVVLYDEFAAKTAETYCRVLNFLGVDADRRAGTFPVINGSQTVKRQWLRTLMSDPLVRGTAIATRAWLPAPLFAAMQQIESQLMQLNIRPAKRAPMDGALRWQLQREFAPEVNRFEELLGRELPSWKASEPKEAMPLTNPAPAPEGHSSKVFKDARGSNLRTCSNS